MFTKSMLTVAAARDYAFCGNEDHGGIIVTDIPATYEDLHFLNAKLSFMNA